MGTANATSGGWKNLGGGVTQALMPLICQGILRFHGNNFDEDCARCPTIVIVMMAPRG